MVRVIASAVLFVVIISGIIKGTGAAIFGTVAAFLVFTGITGFCPLYAFIGVSTLPGDGSDGSI